MGVPYTSRCSPRRSERRRSSSGRGRASPTSDRADHREDRRGVINMADGGGPAAGAPATCSCFLDYGRPGRRPRPSGRSTGSNDAQYDVPDVGVAADDWTVRDELTQAGERVDRGTGDFLTRRCSVDSPRGSPTSTATSPMRHLRAGGLGDQGVRHAGLLSRDPAVPLRRVVKGLSDAGSKSRRGVVEKPRARSRLRPGAGRGAPTATLDESIHRIDHYLGKMGLEEILTSGSRTRCSADLEPEL